MTKGLLPYMFGKNWFCLLKVVVVLSCSIIGKYILPCLDVKKAFNLGKKYLVVCKCCSIKVFECQFFGHKKESNMYEKVDNPFKMEVIIYSFRFFIANHELCLHTKFMLELTSTILQDETNYLSLKT